MKSNLIGAVTLLAALGMNWDGRLGPALAQDSVVRPQVSGSRLPQIFRNSSAADRIGAIRTAELDASRALLERVYCAKISGSTTVYDLLIESDELQGELTQFIKGVATRGRPEYQEDGQVWVVRSLKLRQVLETIERRVRTKSYKGKLSRLDAIESVSQSARDKVISGLGNGALPGSVGLKRIQAKRAAELDAYRSLAERLMGVQIASNTTVRDFVLQSDVIRARMAHAIKGGKNGPVVYNPDDHSCEVTKEIVIAEVFEVIRRYAGNDLDGRQLEEKEREYSTKSFSATGRGAPRSGEGPRFGGARPSQPLDEALYEEVEIILRKVSEHVVVE